MRELASRVKSSDVVVNAVNPGFCKMGLMRNARGVVYYLSGGAQFLLGREAVDGARCLVDAAVMKGPEAHGLYLSEMQIKVESDLVRSAKGKELVPKDHRAIELAVLANRENGLVYKIIIF